ncbi:MAG: response regulator, partial [Magnetococcales bacterium]|nr:response regulator [Magnetococcales bacterium]
MDSSRPKILLVDDNPGNLRILAETLRHDYTIVVARDGETALQLARESNPPDVILLDVMMPGMDGFEVCLRLKSDPITWSIPVLFVTALAETEAEVRGLTVGAVDFITKPIVPRLVKARVRSQVELKRHKDHLEELVEQRTREIAITQEATIHALASLAETRDPETGGHIRRTQHYVRILASVLQRHPRFRDTLTDTMVDMLFKSAP